MHKHAHTMNSLTYTFCTPFQHPHPPYNVYVYMCQGQRAQHAQLPALVCFACFCVCAYVPLLATRCGWPKTVHKALQHTPSPPCWCKGKSYFSTCRLEWNLAYSQASLARVLHALVCTVCVHVCMLVPSKQCQNTHTHTHTHTALQYVCLNAHP